MDRAPLAWPRRAVFALAVLALSFWDVAPAAAGVDSRVHVAAQFTAQADDAAKAAAVFRAHAGTSRR